MSIEKSEIRRYKGAVPFEMRSRNAKQLMTNYPGKIPVAMVPEENCTFRLPNQKFLIRGTLTVGEFVRFIRNKCNIKSDRGLYVFLGNNIPAQSLTLNSLYENHADEDGHMYMMYTEHEDKGSDITLI